MTPGLPELLALYDPGPGRSVRGGMVLSVDGSVAVDGTSRGLSTPADRAVFHALRTLADVVLVGAGTARAERYGPVRLPAEHRAAREAAGRPPVPLLAVVTRNGDLAGTQPDLVVTRAGVPVHGDVLRAGQDQVDVAAALDGLADRGLTRVLCEGGPALLGDLVAAGLLDELCMTLSPALAGHGPGMLAAPLPSPVPLRLVHLVEADGSLLLRWSLRP